MTIARAVPTTNVQLDCFSRQDASAFSNGRTALSSTAKVLGLSVSFAASAAWARPSVCVVKASAKVMAGERHQEARDFDKQDCEGKCSIETALKGLWVAAGEGPKVRIVRREETARVGLVGEGWMQSVSHVALDAGFPKHVAKPGGLVISATAEQPNVFEIPLAWGREIASVFSGYDICDSDPDQSLADSPHAVMPAHCNSQDPKPPQLIVWKRGAMFAQHGDTYYGGGDQVAAATNGAVVAVASARKDISEEDAPSCVLEVVTMRGGSKAARNEQLRVVERCGKSNHTTLPAGLWDNLGIALEAGGTSVTAFTQGGKIHLATLPPPNPKATVAAKAVIKTVGPARGRLAIAFDTTTQGSNKIFLGYTSPDGTLILTRLSATEPGKSTERAAIKGARDPSIVVTGDRAYVAWIRNGTAQVVDLVALLEHKRVAPTQVSAQKVRASFPALTAASDNGPLWIAWGESPTPNMSPNIHAAMLECTDAAHQR